MQDQTPGQGPVAGAAGRVLSRLYGAVMARRNARFDAGRGVVDLGTPVISVGNLSVGGTGKTPMVGHLVRLLLDAGRRPCIAMRGYKAGAGRSDEAEIYRRAFPAVPVVARPDRGAGLRELFARAEGEHIDRVVLDDGFQHRRLKRDLDIVLIDASRDPFRDRLLPAGWLREPVESLARADVVVVTHAELVDEEELSVVAERVRRVRGGEGEGRGPEAVTRHQWAGLDVSGGEGEGVTEWPVRWLAGRRVVAACAIGHPGAFLAALKMATGAGAGGGVVGTVVRPDHDPFEPATVDRIVALAGETGADAILTTEKDWSKLGRVATGRWPCPVVRARLAMAFDSGEERLAEAVLGVARGDGGGRH